VNTVDQNEKVVKKVYMSEFNGRRHCQLRSRWHDKVNECVRKHGVYTDGVRVGRSLQGRVHVGIMSPFIW